MIPLFSSVLLVAGAGNDDVSSPAYTTMYVPHLYDEYYQFRFEAPPSLETGPIEYAEHVEMSGAGSAPSLRIQAGCDDLTDVREQITDAGYSIVEETQSFTVFEHSDADESAIVITDELVIHGFGIENDYASLLDDLEGSSTLPNYFDHIDDASYLVSETRFDTDGAVHLGTTDIVEPDGDTVTYKSICTGTDGVLAWHAIQRRRSELALAVGHSLDSIPIDYLSEETAVVSVTVDPSQLTADMGDQYEFPASRFDARIGSALDRDLFSLIEDNVYIDSGEEVSIQTLDRMQSITDPVLERYIDRQRRQIDRYDVLKLADGPSLRESESETDTGVTARDLLDRSVETIRQAGSRLTTIGRRILKLIRKLMKRLRE